MQVQKMKLEIKDWEQAIMSAEMALKEAQLNIEMFGATLAHAQLQKSLLEAQLKGCNNDEAD